MTEQDIEQLEVALSVLKVTEQAFLPVSGMIIEVVDKTPSRVTVRQVGPQGGTESHRPISGTTRVVPLSKLSDVDREALLGDFMKKIDKSGHKSRIDTSGLAQPKPRDQRRASVKSSTKSTTSKVAAPKQVEAVAADLSKIEAFAKELKKDSDLTTCDVIRKTAKHFPARRKDVNAALVKLGFNHHTVNKQVGIALKGE